MNDNQKYDNWYVLQVHTGAENAVVRSLQDRIRLHNLENVILELLVPVEEVIDVRQNKKGETKKYVVKQKFFQGYVLVKALMDANVRHTIVSTPKVLGFLGSSNANELPHKISQSEIAAIFDRMNANSKEKPKLKVELEIGENVRVIQGVFADYEGKIDEIDYANNQVVIMSAGMGGLIPIKVDITDVERF